MTAAAPDPNRAARIDEALAGDPNGVIETIAAETGATYAEVLARLPAGAARAVGADRFEEIWTEISTWGPVLFLIHTGAGVFEIDTPLVPGSFGRGYYNVHGAAPLHGHIAADRCAAIHFVDRPFFGRRSCSVQFVDREGGAMFKVFVRRGPDRTLDAGQLERYEALRARMAG